MRRAAPRIHQITALCALLIAAACAGARAQVPAFDDIDWLFDRGEFSSAAGAFAPLRQGYNNFNKIDSVNPLLNNNPGHANRRWVFPLTRDLGVTSTAPNANGGVAKFLVLDNPNKNDPNDHDPVSQPNGDSRYEPFSTVPATPPTAMPHAFWLPALTSFTIPAPANRAPNRGFSFDTDQSKDYNFDYGYAPATHNDFLVDTANGQAPITPTDLQQFPNAPPAVYKAVQTVLVASTQPTAAWTSGATLPAGRYGIDIYSPGDGTIDTSPIAPVAHPNVTHAFVRVSWGANTVDPTGAPIAGGVNDPATSRIFVVDLGQSGWIHIAGGGLGPASFPFDGKALDELVVTLYTVTPDNDKADPTTGSNAPYVTADAVRFVPQPTGSAALGPIAGTGRILAPVVGTNKISDGAANVNQPLVYLAREEAVPADQLANPPQNSHADPTDPNSAPATDPTGLYTVPVFYCLDNRPGNSNGNTDTSLSRVRWRYVGAADQQSSSGASATSIASPLLANVRRRSGPDQAMVYFFTTDALGHVGHVYALDAAGDPTNRATTAFWIYPSVRPLTAQEASDGNVPLQYHDPNYNGYTPLTNAPNMPKPDPSFVYRDGDIIPNPANSAQLIVRGDTQVTFPGIQASAIVVDDPSNQSGSQVLVVPGMDGRIYALEAGGRGDESPTIAGTTPRYWTWPHLGADAYHANGNVVGPNKIADEPAKGPFTASIAYDPTYPAPLADLSRLPAIVGSADGHVYAFDVPHDNVPSLVNGVPQWTERLEWTYPGLTAAGLGGAVSTTAIFNKAVFFTSAGRVYSIAEAPGTTPDHAPQLSTLRWAFPSTPNPPSPDPADPMTAALDPGFTGGPPIVASKADLNKNGPGTAASDMVYALQSNGTVLALNADPTSAGATTLLATGRSDTQGNTSCAPLLTLLQGLTGFAQDVTTLQPAIVFADDDGSIWGVRAVPDTTKPSASPISGAAPAGGSLTLIWGHDDSASKRSAAPILVNGVIVQGDEGGQLRAYSGGTEDTSSGDATVGTGERPSFRRGAAGQVSIDLRVLDIYKKADWDNFALQAGPAIPPQIPPQTPKTPGRTTTGGPLGPNSVTPALGNLAMGKPHYGVDWGDSLYVSAWGVYHGQAPLTSPLIPGLSNVPVIQVTFNISQRGVPSRQVVVTVPPTSPTLNNPAVNWPDDIGVDPVSHETLQIYGQDSAASPPSQHTGRAQNVFPWVAKVEVPILPDAANPFVPGASGITVTATARITQIVLTNGTPPLPSLASSQSNSLQLGQHNYPGYSNSATPISSDDPSLGAPRPVYITNPIALTVRGGSAGSDSTDSANNPNIIGWAPGISGPLAPYKNTGELLHNGNGIQGIDGTTPTTAIKALFAPIGLIPDGGSQSYGAVDASGNSQPAFFAMDRSNIQQRRGAPLKVQVKAHPFRWLGGPSTVMNPLPWEQFPTDAGGTNDYPDIAPRNLSVQNSAGDDAIATSITLTPPTYPGTDPTQRVPQLTRLNLTVRVPRYQPANVNRGVVSSGGTTFGAGYREISGILRGANASSDPIIGPLRLSDGKSVGMGPASFPAAGYVSEAIVVAVPPGVTPNNRGASQDFFAASRADGTTVNQAFRAFEMGAAVSPSVRMRVLEQTLDLGKLPHGFGYSDVSNGAYRVPFRPSSSLGPSLWDPFFLPFTLVNESNVSLYDVRLAKLTGGNGAKYDAHALSAGSDNTLYDISARLNSEQVSSFSLAPLFGAPFGIGQIGSSSTDNIGITSSFDHANPTMSAETSFWPQANPYVTATGIAAASPGGLPANWSAGVQGQPTVHKPRVGDTSGVPATIPDVPYGASTLPDGSRPQSPKVSVAIPLGQPVGTYANPIYPYEDTLPLQWREWLGASSNLGFAGRDHDAVLNANALGQPLEPHADPTFILKVTVRESRLTTDATRSAQSVMETLPQIDQPGSSVTPANLLPAAAAFPGTAAPGKDLPSRIALYWTTNRVPSGATTANTPYLLATSSLQNPYLALPQGLLGDSIFAVNGQNAQWWQPPSLFPSGGTALFPSGTGNVSTSGTPIPSTLAHASPTIAGGTLFWQGSVTRKTGNTQVVDSRTFYTALDPSTTLPTGQVYSFPNDPALAKFSPKALAHGSEYLFWHAGNQTRTSLYYKFAAYGASGLPQPNAWSEDLRLPVPESLAWVSDPSPVTHIAPTAGGDLGAIDVVATASFKNRQKVETVLLRYHVNPDGTLALTPQAPVYGETLSRNGATRTWASRDAAWALGTGPNGTRTDADNRSVGLIAIYVNGKIVNGQVVGAGVLPGSGTTVPQVGRADLTSGLVYYDSALGGQLVVDTRTGLVSFPTVAPGRNDTVTADYVPMLMRLNTSRGDSNLVASQGYGNFGTNLPPVFRPHPAVDAPGSSRGPVAIMDLSANPRAGQKTPLVVFNAGNAPAPVTRLWTIFRRTDIASPVQGTLFYKAMRLMVKLPFPVALDANGQIANMNITTSTGPLKGAYEVDWVRGRIYFTSLDEGATIRVNYQSVKGPSGNLTYTVAWGDELTGASQLADDTIQEAPLPIDAARNEGQVTAFKDPQLDKLWIFWASTRDGKSDLYYETFSPQLYAIGSGER